MSEASMQNTHFCKNIQPKQTLIIIKINTTQKNHKNLQKTRGNYCISWRQTLKEQRNIYEEHHAKEIVCRCFACIRDSHRYNEVTWDFYITLLTKIHKQISLTCKFCHITCIVRAMANEEAPRENNRWNKSCF